MTSTDSARIVSSPSPGTGRRVAVVGAGVAGTWQALKFAEAGCEVVLHERGDGSLRGATSYWAGGMLAPDCEAEVSEPVIGRLGRRSLELWREALPEIDFKGSLIVAHPRDRADFDRFARLTAHHEPVDAAGIAELEPALAGRFREGLFFPHEGHVEPRRVLPALWRKLAERGVAIRFGSAVDPAQLDGAATDGTVIDCRGLAARGAVPALRGVKGEVVIVETREIALSRPVRLIHPRWPLYIIPRPDGRFLIGATTIETEDEKVSVRSALELLTAAYAVHPAFGEARIVEIGAGLRPAFPNHAPRIALDGGRVSVNGLYRHGFLLAPALAEAAVNAVLHGVRDAEVVREVVQAGDVCEDREEAVACS